MIQISALSKTFAGGTRAIDNLELNVKEGEILALLGPNGAGKTTTIRVCTTLSGFDEGKVIIAGHDVDEADEAVRRSIGLVAQQTGIDYFLTGRENLMVQGHLYRLSRSKIESRIEELAHYFELDEALDRLVTTYSGGMRRKLDIATALIHRPKILFLDEPTLGLDIKSRQNLWNYIKKLNQEQQLTILLTTHYLEEADHLSHRVAIINQGKIQVIGRAEELKNSIHGDAVIITFESDGPEIGDFTYQMNEDPEVKEVIWKNDKLFLYVDNGGEAVAKFVRIANEQNIRIKNLSLARPTLDDVFLKYTGATLSDSEEEEGEEWWHQWAGKGGGGNWQKNQAKWQNQIEESGSDEQKEEWGEQWEKWQQNDDSKPQEKPATQEPPDVAEKQEKEWPSDGNWSADEQKNWQQNWKKSDDDQSK